MAYIEWSAELETGIAVIDQDHRILVSLLNQVHEAIGDAEEAAVLGSVLNSLTEYTQYHFSREEKLLEVAGYPGLADHRRRHNELRAQLEGIRSQYERSLDSLRGTEVMEFLRSWLVEHILKQDMSYRDICQANKAAQRAVESMRFGEDEVEGDEPETGPLPLDWAAMSVLVVDDNRNFQTIVQTLLKSLGVYRIAIADNASEALDILGQTPADLVLCDWRMDGMDGLEFVREARSRGVSAKILMMSGYGPDKIRAQAEDAGVDDLLEKPITAHGFLEAVARTMTSPRAGQD